MDRKLLLSHTEDWNPFFFVRKLRSAKDTVALEKRRVSAFLNNIIMVAWFCLGLNSWPAEAWPWALWLSCPKDILCLACSKYSLLYTWCCFSSAWSRTLVRVEDVWSQIERNLGWKPVQLCKKLKTWVEVHLQTGKEAQSHVLLSGNIIVNKSLASVSTNLAEHGEHLYFIRVSVRASYTHRSFALDYSMLLVPVSEKIFYHLCSLINPFSKKYSTNNELLLDDVSIACPTSPLANYE